MPNYAFDRPSAPSERRRPRVAPAIDGILLTAAFAFAAIAVRAASPGSQVLNAYLSEHPQLRRATVSDCGACSDDIEKVRRGDPPNWPAVPNYEPYEISADLNGDGEPDAAVVLFDTAKASNPFTLVIFNGPFRANRIAPSFIQRNLDLRGGGLFFGPPRPKPYRLVVGAFESEGAIIEPTGQGYRWGEAEE
jgi:hypothetical protein